VSWRSYFEGQLKRAEIDLEYVRKMPGFRLREHTQQGERDVTAEHIQFLEGVVAEYRRVLASISEGE